MRKTIITISKFSTLVILALVLVVVSCERDLSEDSDFATFPTTADIYTDAPVNLTDEFFVSFDPALGANTEAFGTDDNVAYEGNSSIRIDVPSPDDPNGNFVGGIFLDRGNGRDLTSYDALTFWARASTTATLGLAGFGTDFVENKYAVATGNLALSTDWRKYVIPIPDPSKLVQEKGMFVFSAGGLDIIDNIPNGNELGFTFWMDELRFEHLGTIGQSQPIIFDGQDTQITSFNGSEIPITGLTQILNVAGDNVTLGVAPAYYSFESDNPDVASVSDAGIISVNGEGVANITASLAGVAAQGSIEITSLGNLPLAETPMISPDNVASVFSDAYTPATTINIEPGFGGSTTSASISGGSGATTLVYSNNNFTGIIFENTIDATNFDTMHVDVFVTDANATVEFQIRDIGTNGIINTDVFTGNPNEDDADRRFTASGLTVGEWNSIDIPLDGGIAMQKDNLGAIILVGGPDFILDNIYFYTTP